MPVEPMEGCCCKPDMKKEAQRTNRFNTSSSNISAPSSSTPCNRLEGNSSRISNDCKMQVKDDVPCINIILKPILDSKIEQKDESVQIVEITAVTENFNKYSIDSTSPSPFDTNRAEPESKSSRMEKVETKCVKMQTEGGKIYRDISMQTADSSNDRININICKMNHSTPGNRNVQFKDDEGIVDKLNRPNSTSYDIPFSSKNNSLWNVDFDDSTTIPGSDTHCARKITGEALVSLLECLDSTETSDKSVNNERKLNETSHLKPCMKNSEREDDAKLSERIKRKIDKLANTSQETKSPTDFLPCTDMCKQIATQEELFNIYSEKIATPVDESYPTSKNTDTLPSVLSNNSPIPRISIDTTEIMEKELPSINESDKVTTDTTFLNSRDSIAPINIPCCSDQNSAVENFPSRLRNLTAERNSSENVSCGSERYPENNGVTIRGNEENESILTKKNIEEFNSGLGIGRGFFADEVTTLSELGIAETKSTNTSNERKSIGTNLTSSTQTGEYQSAIDNRFGERSDFLISSPITRNNLTASDLTRPEFIRMLTEIKEHTCSLEIQLSAMNEAMKRKQAIRTKAFSSALKNDERPRQNQKNVRKKLPEKSNTIHESMCCTSEVSSIENLGNAREELQIDNSMDNSLCCTPSDEISISENDRLKNDSEDISRTCCEKIIGKWESHAPLKSHKKLKPSTRTDRSNKPGEIILLQEDSNVSLRKHKPKKPAFKTKRSYLWAPLRHSDFRLWKRKLHKATPSAESMAVPGIILQSISPEPSMVERKVDVSCGPTSCCNRSDISPPTPVLKTMFKAALLKPGTCSTTSNPFINQTNAKSSFFTSTPKKLATKHKISNESGSKSDHKLRQTLNTVPRSLDLDSSTYSSNFRRKCSEGTRMELDAEASDLNEKPAQRHKLRSRLGVRKNPVEDQTKNSPTIIPSNSHLCPLENRESSRNVYMKNCKTQHDPSKRSFFQLKKLGCIPRLKRITINNKNPSDTNIQAGNSQTCVDEACCSPINCNDEIIAKKNIPPHANQTPADEVLAKNVSCGITIEENTSFPVNEFNKYDSEEEVHSTNYAVNKSVEEYRYEEFENNGNSKKRKRESGSRESTGFDGKLCFNDSIDSEVPGKAENNFQSFQYQEDTEYNPNNMRKVKSVKIQGGDRIVEKCCENNSPQNNDSKCTIRVTVSLDEAASNEEEKCV